MRRRTVLAALAASLSGCGSAADPTATQPPETTPATEAPTETPTATATAAGTPSATPVAGDPTHGLGERFVVEGERPVAYTFTRFLSADRLGPIGREADQGAFLVADCTVENRWREPLAVPVEEIVLRGGVRLFARQDDTDAAAADDRVDLPPLTDETTFPGTPVRGVLAFDVPADPDNDYYLSITPPGDAEEPVHRVPLGRLADLPALS